MQPLQEDAGSPKDVFLYTKAHLRQHVAMPEPETVVLPKVDGESFVNLTLLPKMSVTQNVRTMFLLRCPSVAASASTRMSARSTLAHLATCHGSTVTPNQYAHHPSPTGLYLQQTLGSTVLNMLASIVLNMLKQQCQASHWCHACLQ